MLPQSNDRHAGRLRWVLRRGREAAALRARLARTLRRPVVAPVIPCLFFFYISCDKFKSILVQQCWHHQHHHHAWLLCWGSLQRPRKNELSSLTWPRPQVMKTRKTRKNKGVEFRLVSTLFSTSLLFKFNQVRTQNWNLGLNLGSKPKPGFAGKKLFEPGFKNLGWRTWVFTWGRNPGWNPNCCTIKFGNQVHLG